MVASIDGANDWQEVHDLPAGTILVDGDGHAYQVARSERWPGETWLCPASDGWAFIVRTEADPMIGPKVGSYPPAGGVLSPIWEPK